MTLRRAAISIVVLAVVPAAAAEGPVTMASIQPAIVRRHVAPRPMLAEPPRPWLDAPPAAWSKEAPRPISKGAPRPWVKMAPFPSCGASRWRDFRPRTGPTEYDPLIREIATRHGIAYALVKAVIKAESDFDHLAVSPAGAQGLMQLMPATADDHRVCNVFVPRDNIEGGCRHLRELLDRYRGDLALALAAYNAGVKRVEEAGGVPPIAETREYLERVLRYRVAYEREIARP